MDTWILVVTLMTGEVVYAPVTAYECKVIPARLERAPQWIKVFGEDRYAAKAECAGRLPRGRST